MRAAVAAAVAVALCVVATTVGVIVLIGHGQKHSGDESTSTTLSATERADQKAAQAWETQVSGSFSRLVSDVPDLAKGAREWLSGERSTEQFKLELDSYLGDFTAGRDQLASIEPFPKAPEAAPLYRASANLYVESLRVYEVAVTTVPGDGRGQLDLLARRVRELADRIFDRGRAAMAPFLREQTSPDVQINLPEEVPEWAPEGLAAAPPLDDPPPPRADSPPLRQPHRPEEPLSRWEDAVRGLGLPSQDHLGAAIDTGSADELRGIARAFTAAAEKLRSEPDPQGKREMSAVARLSLLVDAEAARAAQAGVVIGNSDLADVAKKLDAIGADVWPAPLGKRAA